MQNTSPSAFFVFHVYAHKIKYLSIQYYILQYSREVTLASL